MKTNKEIYNRLLKLNKDVKEKLRLSGIVVPIKRDNDTIQLGYFYIKKVNAGHYNIVDSKNYVIVEGINLPQTAILLANKLALGKWLDNDILQVDKKYGFALFDEQLHKQLCKLSMKKKNYDRAEIMEDKSKIATRKKDYHKKTIMSNFEKLMDIR